MDAAKQCLEHAADLIIYGSVTYSITSYGRHWRKDVANQCLECGADLDFCGSMTHDLTSYSGCCKPVLGARG